MTIEVNGKTLETDEEGYLANLNDWEKDVAELKTDVRYIREDITIMQKQIRDLNQTSNMGIGGLKVALFIGGILSAIWVFVKLMK